MGKFEGPFQVRAGLRDQERDEDIVLAEVERCVVQGVEMSTCDHLAELLGGAAVSTTVNVLQRLEAKGLVKVQRYQRSRHVYHVGLGRWTKEPANKAPHWRSIAERSAATPTLPIHTLRSVPTVMMEIETMMREDNLTLPMAQIALMSRGVAHRAMEREERKG